MLDNESAVGFPAGLIPGLLLLMVVFYWRARHSWVRKTSLR